MFIRVIKHIAYNQYLDGNPIKYPDIIIYHKIDIGRSKWKHEHVFKQFFIFYFSSLLNY